MAGIALSQTDQSDRIRRELTPVGHLFIPVFFLQIGIDADITAFARAEVLRDAAILLAVAVVGKLLSPLGAIGAPGDKPLIGLGHAPPRRGRADLRHDRPAERRARRRPLRRPPPRRAGHDARHPAAPQAPLHAAARRQPSTAGTPRDTPPPEGGWLAGRARRRRARRSAARRPRRAAGPRRRRSSSPAAARTPPCSTGWPRRCRPKAHGIRASPPPCSTSSSAATSARGGSSRPPASSTSRCPSWPRPSVDRARDSCVARRLQQPPAAGDGAAAPPRRGRPAVDRGAGAGDTSTGCCSRPSSSRRSRTSPTQERTAGLLLTRLDLEPADVEFVREPHRRPAPPLVGGAPTRRPHGGAGPAAGRPPRHARAGPGPLRAERAPQRRTRALGDAAPPRPVRPRAGRPGRRHARRRRGALTGGAPDHRSVAGLLEGEPGATERLGARAPRLRAAHAVDSPRPPRPPARPAARPGAPRGRDRRRRTWAGGSTSRGRTTPAGWRPSPRSSPTASSPSTTPSWPPGPTAPCSTPSTSPSVRGPDADALAAAIQEASGQPMTAPPSRTPRSTSTRRRRRGTRCARCGAPIAARPAPRTRRRRSWRLGSRCARPQVTAHDGLVIDRFEVTDRDGGKLSDEEIERLEQYVRSGVTAKRRRFGRRLNVRVPAES